MSLLRPMLTHSRRSTVRTFTTTAVTGYQHVLYLGSVLGYTAVQGLAKFPRTWLDSVGVSNDVDHGLRFTDVCGGTNHVLLAYTLVDPPMVRRSGRCEHVVRHGQSFVVDDEQGEVVDVQGRTATSAHPSKVFALGRNTHAQLGLGFSSQEATRGMVTGQLPGQAGITHIVASSTSSLVITATNDKCSNMFGFGNDTLGQLGCSPPTTRTTANQPDPYDVSTRLSDSGSPQLNLLPLPKPINVGTDWKVRSVAAGLDHSVMLLEKVVNGYVVQRVVSTGLNTDGQLGITPQDAGTKVPIEPLLSSCFQTVPLALKPFAQGDQPGGKVVDVVCGADTSYAVTAGSDLWVWGNSEYGQSFAGVCDRIVAPVWVRNPLPAAYRENGLAYDQVPRVQKLVAGGSFAAILDSQGRVWVVGHGPRTDTAPDHHLCLVTAWPDTCHVSQLFSGLEYLLAITTPDPQVYIWGIPPRSISPIPSEPPHESRTISPKPPAKPGSTKIQG